MMSTFLSENKELTSEWDFEKNAELKLFPEKLTEGSNKKAWWKCKNGHTWQEPIYQRWQGKQCPFCTNKRVLVGYNDLPTLFPELAREWDAEENKNIDLLSVVPGSSKTVNWKCSVCGYKWKTSIRQRTQRKTGCPECAKAKRATARTKTILKHSGSVADFEIAKQWNHEKNIGLSPEQFSPSSNKSVWWKCPTCGYERKAKICNRVNLGRGCPVCANQVVIPGKNDLATLRPELAKEWHPTANGSLTPQQVSPGSRKKVWWLCPHGHSYQASLLHRGHGTGCPLCNAGRQTSFAEQALFYYVRKVYPDAISRCTDILPGRMELDIYIPSIRLGIEYDGAYWHRNKQTSELKKYRLCTAQGIKLIRVKEKYTDADLMTADMIYNMDDLENRKQLELMIRFILDKLDPSSNFWTRKKPFHFHSDIVVNLQKDQFKIREHAAPLTENSLAVQRPDLAAEWHPSKNHNLTPEMVTPGSDLKVWWKCRSCGYEWQTSVGHRVNGTGCKRCYQERNRQNHPLSKKIHQYSLDGKFIQEWKSISEAARTLHISSSNITMCAKNLRNQAGGYRWKYPPESALL